MGAGLIALLAAGAVGGLWLLMRSRIKFIPSPSHSAHTTGPWEGVVVHYTAGGSYTGTVQWFQNAAAKVSTHYVIGRNGEIVQMVPLDRNAWHTGETFNVHTSNRYLVGIELANHGRLVLVDGKLRYNTGGRGSGQTRAFRGEAAQATLRYKSGEIIPAYWEKYPGLQIAALVWLLGELNVVHGVPLNLWGHEDICKPRARKKDPGPLFPWRLMPGTRVQPQTWSDE